MIKGTFTGFSQATIDFYRDLAENNAKPWFEENRPRYEQDVLTPARAFVLALGAALREVRPPIHAEPKVNRSLFKIYRDTRFRKDKTPFKNHLAMFFWEGAARRMDCSGMYIHVEPDRFGLGVGIYRFPKRLMTHYRQAVLHPQMGARLIEATGLAESLGYDVGEQGYKRLPKGVPADHPRAEFTKFMGLFCWKRFDRYPPEFFSAGLVDFCRDRFTELEPVHQWLVELTASAYADEAGEMVMDGLDLKPVIVEE